jgi:hypothetical protein
MQFKCLLLALLSMLLERYEHLGLRRGCHITNRHLRLDLPHRGLAKTAAFGCVSAYRTVTGTFAPSEMWQSDLPAP